MNKSLQIFLNIRRLFDLL